MELQLLREAARPLYFGTAFQIVKVIRDKESFLTVRQVFSTENLRRKRGPKKQTHSKKTITSWSDKATINAKPQLEIFADDVKCSHGCTIDS
jgi:Fe-S cluster assembly scaffold protein SufB